MAMGSLADEIKEKEDLSEALEGQIALAESDATTKRAKLDAVKLILAELTQVNESAATTSQRLDKAATDVDAGLALATNEITALGQVLETLQAGLPAALDTLAGEALVPAPGPPPGPPADRDDLADYEGAVAAAESTVLNRKNDVETARKAKADALATLSATEALGAAARQALDAAMTELTSLVQDGSVARDTKDNPAAAVARFRIAKSRATAVAKKQAVEAAADAVVAAADAVATKQDALEQQEALLAAAELLLQQERELLAQARAAVEKKIIDHVTPIG
jgi:hypothetical protein